MMDGGDFWHVARGGGHETMPHQNAAAAAAAAAALRFRPIAPKPVVGGAFPGVVSPERASVSLTADKRVKRKYVRVRKDHDNNSPRRKRSNVGKGLNFVKGTTGESPANSGGSRSRSPAEQEEGVVESVVTVEHVTDASCMEEEGVGGGLSGCTDAERVKSLETDTCPGFVSDGSLSKVEWVNEAYRRMVAGGGGRLPQVAVRLASRTTNSGTHPQLGGCTDGALFFTCHVRVQYCVNNSNNNNNKKNNSDNKKSNNNNNNNNNKNKEKMYWKIMPCDVWRLDSGGFAWKLDIKAALSLGL